MGAWIYDFEVFAYNWLVVFKEYKKKQYRVFIDDNDSLKDFINQDDIYIGFNSKGYDQYILKAVCSGFTPQQVKRVNDWIIGGRQGWEYGPLRDEYFKFNNVDIMDDMQVGMSLKSIEAHLGMDIKETEVDFNLNRPLTVEEIERTKQYCIADVNATEKVVELREDYLKNKINIGKLAGLSAAESLSMTNAKLTAKLLKAKRVEHYDERQYVYPTNLLTEYIPQEVFDFFNRMYDPNLSDEAVFSSSLELNIGKCPVKIAYGGIHGAIPNYIWKQEEGDK